MKNIIIFTLLMVIAAIKGLGQPPCTPPVITCPASLTVSSTVLPLDLFSILPGYIGSLNCAGATSTGTLTDGTAASGVSSVISYVAGNGGIHSGQTVTSTGVTGLTATLAAGTFANGSGTVTYTITGTPGAAGTASFAINIGGKSCTLTRTVDSGIPVFPAGTVHCNPSFPTAIVVVTSTTGKIWMDRNLGASQKATSATDVNAYGDLYQWGRRADGHQCRTSTVTSTLSSSDQPAHADFITNNITPRDWRNPQNNSLWQGVNGINNPCPSGFRLPTNAELDAERLSWTTQNPAGAYGSPLKWTSAGYRFRLNASIEDAGTNGYYFSSTEMVTINVGHLFITANTSAPVTQVNQSNRADGRSVRCIKDVQPPPPGMNGALDDHNNTGARGMSSMTPGASFSGDGVTGNTFDNVPGQYTITYTYTDENNCPNDCQFNITVPTTPSAPTNLVPTPGIGEITINFTPGNDGGSPITNYEYTLDGGVNWIPFNPAVTGTTVTVTNLTCGSTYTIQLRAVNAVGAGVSSTTANATIDNTVTISYTGVTIATATNKSAQVTLSATVTLPVGANVALSKLRFINRNTGQPISGWVAITAGAQQNTGTASYTPHTLTLGTNEIFRKYSIGFEVGNTGCFTRNSPSDDATITLAEPSCGCY
jgi:uncharacterized protein (TIGR02145 family)